MTAEHLPAEEDQLLRAFGFGRTTDNLDGIIYRVREAAAARRGLHRELPPSYELEWTRERIEESAKDHDRLSEIEEELAVVRGQRRQDSNRDKAEQSTLIEQQEDLEQQSETKRKPRRWWKGIGQIVQGLAMSLADSGLAAGILVLPVSPDTQSWVQLSPSLQESARS